MKRILCLKFPGWPLQRLVAARPELRQTLNTRAIVIHRPDARRGDMVRLCSALAWRRGVRPGMPLAEATVLFRSEQEVMYAEHDPAADLKLLAKIAAWCERYSPLVGWETIPGGRKELLSALPPASEPEALYLDITGIGALFGGEEKLAENLLEEVICRGFTARVGIASTIGAAWALAAEEPDNDSSFREAKDVPSPRYSGERVRVRGRVGTDSTPHPGPLPGVPGRGSDVDLTSVLTPLPLTSLRLSDEHLATLGELGLTTIGQLLALPRQSLSSRFGPGLLLRLDQALGEASELIQPHHPPPAFQAEWLLEHPTQRREEVELILQQLVERVAIQLAQRQAGAVRMACRLDVAGHEPLSFTMGLYRPTASQKHLLELVQMQLERLRLSGAVGRVGLSVLLTAPLEIHQAQLFDDISLRSARARALLLDRLSSRLGAEAVLQPLLRAEALPERRARLVAVAGLKSRGAGEQRGRGAKKSPSLPRSSAPLLPCHRPLLLLSPPQAIETTALAPDGPPVRFWHERREQRIARHWGPERIETAWWRGRIVCRDYYRVETITGQGYWLFRERRKGGWFLHGAFE
jgi:protein ImuB